MTFMSYGTVRHGHTGPSLQSVLNLLPSSLDHSLVGSDCSTTPKQTCAASISVNIRLMLDTRIYLIMPLTQLHLHLHICYTDMDLAQFSSTILHSSGIFANQILFAGFLFLVTFYLLVFPLLLLVFTTLLFILFTYLLNAIANQDYNMDNHPKIH